MSRKSDKPTAPVPAPSMDDALALIDTFGEKVDELKTRFNETAKHAASLTRSTPPSEEGRYAIHTPLKSEYPEPPTTRPEVPRPTPRRVSPPPLPPPEVRHASGRFYIQVPRCASVEELRTAREKLSQLGRVVDSGSGTATDPESGWVELAVKDSDVSALIAKLRANDLTELVEKVIEVEPGEGRLQARQLELFRLKMTSQNDT